MVMVFIYLIGWWSIKIVGIIILLYVVVINGVVWLDENWFYIC